MNKFSLLMGLCLATSLGAQTTLIGTVRDSQNQLPLPGANVVISGGRLSFDTGAATDQDGGYRIPNLSPGSYRLQVFYIGYREYEEEVVITAGTGPELEINLALATLLARGKTRPARIQLPTREMITDWVHYNYRTKMAEGWRVNTKRVSSSK